MCAWAVPEIGVITAVGPVHLERMGSLERIAQAKAEILERAQVAILNVDYPLLADLAQKAEDNGKIVWRCSSKTPEADVSVVPEHGKLHVRTSNIYGAEMDLLVAAAARSGARQCGLRGGGRSFPRGSRAKLWPPVWPTSRALLIGEDARQSANGVNVIDDTYNSNPAGANAAIALLGMKAAADGQKGGRDPGYGRAGPCSGRRERQVRRQCRRGGHATGGGGPHQCPFIAEGRQHGRASGARRPATWRRRWPGFPPTSAPATPSCTRTTCRTITLEPLPLRG